MRVTILLSLLLLAPPSVVLAWGDLGHRAISEAVQANLDPATVKALARIVGIGDELPIGTLARLSLWPDQIRPLTKNPHASIPGFTRDELREAQAFVRTHLGNADWHYVDLPPGSPHYPDLAQSDPTDPVLPFTTPHDIIHMIRRCIEVLETEGESPDFTKLQALRWLLHLVEDIHQPLHVASGYYRTTPAALSHPKMITDPATATLKHAKNDRGGNVLLFLNHPQCPMTRTRENLHSVWDDCLVDVVNGASGCVSRTTDPDVVHLTELLKTQMRLAASEVYRTSGDLHQWAEQWATDALQVSRTRVFTFDLAEGCVIKSDKAPHDPLHVQSRILAPPSKKQYLQSHKDDAEIQLTKAAVRLTDLLNQIQWK